MVLAAVLNGMSEREENVIKALSQVQEFNVRSGDPNQLAQSSIRNLGQQWIDAYQYTVPHLAISRVTSGAIGALPSRTHGS